MSAILKIFFSSITQNIINCELCFLHKSARRVTVFHFSRILYIRIILHVFLPAAWILLLSLCEKNFKYEKFRIRYILLAIEQYNTFSFLEIFFRGSEYLISRGDEA